MEWYKHLFLYGLYASYILYFLILLNLYKNAPNYLSTLNTFIKYYVIIFLLFHFNPLSKHKFDDFDKKIVFNSALFLLSTTTFTHFVITSVVNNNIHSFIF
mgnify:CR=1 FL=1|jgi:hypothetical protein